MDDLRGHLNHLRTSPALAADPRPGTRPLAETALGALGIELVECTPTRVVARMPVGPDPGASSSLLVLAETAASTAAGLAAGPTRRAFGALLDGAMLRVPAPGIVVAIATPLELTPDLHHWRIRVHDASDDLVLDARCTLGIVDAPAG